MTDISLSLRYFFFFAHPQSLSCTDLLISLTYDRGHDGPVSCNLSRYNLSPFIPNLPAEGRVWRRWSIFRSDFRGSKFSSGEIYVKIYCNWTWAHTWNGARVKLYHSKIIVDALRSKYRYYKYIQIRETRVNTFRKYPIQSKSRRIVVTQIVMLISEFLYVATKSPPRSRVHRVSMYILYTVERIWRVCYSFPLCIFDTNINPGVDVVSLRQ